MKRIVRYAVTVAALAVAGSAPATGGKPTAYSGALPGGGEVSFRLSAGADPDVNEISIQGITADCRRGSATLEYNIDGRTPVLADRSFAVRSTDGNGGKAFVKGRFSENYKKVKGAVRVHGRFFDGTARCDSGRQKFRAT